MQVNKLVDTSINDDVQYMKNFEYEQYYKNLKNQEYQSTGANKLLLRYRTPLIVTFRAIIGLSITFFIIYVFILYFAPGKMPHSLLLSGPIVGAIAICCVAADKIARHKLRNLINKKI